MSLVLLLRSRSSLQEESHYEQCFAPALGQVALEQRPPRHLSQVLAPLIPLPLRPPVPLKHHHCLALPFEA